MNSSQRAAPVVPYVQAQLCVGLCLVLQYCAAHLPTCCLGNLRPRFRLSYCAVQNKFWVPRTSGLGRPPGSASVPATVLCLVVLALLDTAWLGCSRHSIYHGGRAMRVAHRLPAARQPLPKVPAAWRRACNQVQRHRCGAWEPAHRCLSAQCAHRVGCLCVCERHDCALRVGRCCPCTASLHSVQVGQQLQLPMPLSSIYDLWAIKPIV